MDLRRLVPPHISRFEAYVPSQPDDVLKKRFGCDRCTAEQQRKTSWGLPHGPGDHQPFDPPRRPCIQRRRVSLRYKLAETFGLHPDQIIAGNGANETTPP
jgi:hypothetical protein